MKEQIICSTCGTWYPAATVPAICPVCENDRQYLPVTGQHWTRPETLALRHSVKLNHLQERLYEMEINPVFAIGQRALLVISEMGNLLWDCIPLLDELTISFIRSKGGLKAIALSHPHYYSNMNDWAEEFGCPVYVHRKDEEHIRVTGRHIRLWEGDSLELWDGMQLHHIGGHFPGSSILRVPFLSAGGTILCGDTLFLSPSKKHFSVMYSYPNRIPLPAGELKKVKQRFDSIPFDAFYGYQNIQNLNTGVKTLFETSMARYFAE